jgi:hypothetical protein
MLLKGINMNTSPTDYQPMEEMALQRSTASASRCSASFERPQD